VPCKPPTNANFLAPTRVSESKVLAFHDVEPMFHKPAYSSSGSGARSDSHKREEVKIGSQGVITIGLTKAKGGSKRV